MALTEYVLTTLKPKNYRVKILIQNRTEPLIIESLDSEDCKKLLVEWSQYLSNKSPKLLVHELFGKGYEIIDVSRIDYIALSEIE